MASSISPGSMLAIGTVFPALGILAVSARFFVRLSHRQGLGADDWLILPALLMVIGQGILTIMGEQQGILGYTLGPQSEDFQTWSLVWILELEFAFAILNVLNTTFVKLSVLYFYRRVFVTGSNRRLDIFTKIFAGVLVAWAIAMIGMMVFTCGTQFSLNWNSTYDQYAAECANIEAEDLSWSVTDFLLDLVLLILPIPLIKRLQLSATRRIGIIFVFLIGSLAILGSLLRIVIFGLAYSGNGFAWLGDDYFIATGVYFYWAMFEGGLGVIVACLPCLQVFIRKASIQQVTKNVRGIFSIQSFTRSFQRTSTRDPTTNEGSSSVSNLHKSQAFVELDEISEHKVDDQESQLRR